VFLVTAWNQREREREREPAVYNYVGVSLDLVVSWLAWRISHLSKRLREK